MRSHALLALGLLLLAGDAAVSADIEYFQIHVIDDETGRGVPLVELRTVNGIGHVTDSAGIVAFHEPGLMNSEVFFHVSSHGYEFRADGFGYRGRRLQVTPGGEATLRMTRINIAERLYRITGGGIYRDSVLLGLDTPIAHPVLNARVLGSDSVIVSRFGDRLYWFWGDTNRPKYPLGNFHVPGATSRLPADGGLDPAVGINHEYFVSEEGFARETARMPGNGPTWLDGLVVLPDEQGRERMLAHFVKIKPPLTVYRQGIVEFDAEAEQFRLDRVLSDDAAAYPMGHTDVRTAVRTEDGPRYVYFNQPFPFLRVPARVSAYRDLDQYESFSCLVPGTRTQDGQIDRTADGRIRYGWKAGTSRTTFSQLKALEKAGKIRSDEFLVRLTDIQSGKSVRPHRGTVYWNAYRQRWVLILCEAGGTSMLGELWYAEADTPEGPWGYATKIVTHDDYSFYNPRHHPFFDQDGGRTIYFEGTYTATFSGNTRPTPRYDYNQIMYRLDLSSARLRLPVPVYDGGAGGEVRDLAVGNTAARGHAILFWMPDQARPGTQPLWRTMTADGRARLVAGARPRRRAEQLGFVAPHSGDILDQARLVLGEITEGDRPARVVVWDAAGEAPANARPLGRVWANPVPVWPL